MSEIVTLDITVQDEGTIVLLHAETAEAEAWFEENVENGQRWGGGRVIEHRYADAIIAGAQADGLAVGF